MSLTTAERTGAIVAAVFTLFSVLALTFILLRTIRLVTVLFLRRNDITFWTPDMLFFRTRLGYYAACIILSNVFISAARLIDFSWVLHSGPTEGSMCTAQVVLLQIGIWSASWFTASQSVHPLSSLVFHIPQTRWSTIANIAIGWACSFIVGLTPLRQHDMYGPIGPSCTIALSHPIERFALQIFPVILGAIVSVTVYCIVFIILHGKLSMNGTQKLDRSNSTNQRRENTSDEYHRFIIMITRTMFWFPLAFVLLFLPFCIMHLLLVAGYPVPTAASVFADVCVSIMGLVNVAILCNTFWVIRRVHNGSRGVKVVVETVKTFGNDASGESPITPPPSQSSTIAYNGNHRTYNSKWSSSNHLSYGLDSSSEPLGAKKVSYESIQTKVPPLATIPPARRRSGNSGVRHVKFQSEMTVDSPPRMDAPDPQLPRVPILTEDNRHDSSGQAEECSIQPMADTVASAKGEKELAFKSKAPPALDLSRFSLEPPPPLSHQVSNKSATLAARLGIPVAPAYIPSTVACSAQKFDKGKGRASVTPISQRVDGSDPRPSSITSSTSTMTVGVDGDSDYSVEIKHACKVRPLPHVLESSKDEEDTHSLYTPTPQDLGARSRRMTTASVWSQETGYTMDESLDMESERASQQLIPNMMMGDQVDVGWMPVVSREVAPRPPPKPLLLPSRIGSRLSGSLLGMFSPKSTNRTFFSGTVNSDSVV